MHHKWLDYPKSIDSNTVLSGHNLCFDRTRQWGLASKHGTWGGKTIQMSKGQSDASLKKLSVKHTILIFMYPAFAAKGCVHYEK